MKKKVMTLSRTLCPPLPLSLLCFNQLLVQAAHWKLQTKELKEQGTVMQTQVTIRIRIRITFITSYCTVHKSKNLRLCSSTFT